MNNGYAICLKEWILDKEIKNELQLLLLISNLCAKLGYCYAKNKYFSEMLDCTEISISQKIKKLIDRGYIEAEYTKRGCEVKERKIRLKNFLTDDSKKFKPTIKNNFNGNNINNNINNYKYKGTVIKLNEKDYNNWQERFDLLDLKYELDKRDIWLASQSNNKNWFISTQQYLLTVQRKKEKEKETQDKISQPWWRE